MARQKWWLLSLLLTITWYSPASAADHRDGPAVRADPAADINDLFAWTSADANRIYLVMTVFPFSTEAAHFSDAVQYVFHTSSQPAFGSDDTSSLEIVCDFDTAQAVRCRAGAETSVSGDASDPAGLVSNDGRLRVFTGPRNDPFFFNLNGFNATTAIVAEAAGELSFDDAGCPQLDAPTSTALVTQLQTEPGGAPAVDDFLGAEGLAIVLVPFEPRAGGR